MGAPTHHPRRDGSGRLLMALLCGVLLTPARAWAEPQPPCEDSLDVAIFTSPRAPTPGSPLHVMVVSEIAVAGASLQLVGDNGPVPVETLRLGGPPWGWVGTVISPSKGRWRAELRSGDGVVACERLSVRRRRTRALKTRKGKDPVWPVRIRWERDTENLYSLWVEHLFRGPPDADLSWRPLHDVIRDETRNLLFDHLGQKEDSGRKIKLAPDCADFPYFLRAYFAWKLGLPFGYRDCNRGNAKRAPRCGEITTQGGPAERADGVASFERLVRKRVANAVQSSTPRTALNDDGSDFYPVELNRRSLRPGAIFADPYGHVMVISSWTPPEGGRSGVLMAADAQPDATVGRRIFWRGSFLFPTKGSVSGPGFKRFRPLVADRDAPEGWRTLTNAEIEADADYADVSTAQQTMSPDEFYEAMDALINPEPLQPERALSGTLDALEQQVLRRVASVDNAEAWKTDNGGTTIEMPDGAEIFVTVGPWEDYSTPARDMRLLIALDAVRHSPSRVEKVPHRFVLPEGETPAKARARLEALLATESAKRRFTYTRSDGSTWTLSLASVVARIERFEMSYNPNDCPALRWAAEPGTDEHSTCRDHAPAAQTERMGTYRPWFRDRRRPLH